jgi:hypothetical protein
MAPDPDPEKGHGDQISDTTTTAQTPLNPFENLHIFQELVGIRSSRQILPKDSPTDNADDGSVVRPDPFHRKGKGKWKSLFFTSSPANDGYYVCAMEEEWKAFIGYQLSNFWINSVYILQIFIAATITALAAYDGHRITLTTLGAVNTVLAGLVAYFKGMGLPNRLRKSRDQYQHVKEYIDYKERQFVWFAKLHGKDIPNKDPTLATLDPWTEAEQVRKLYEAAQKDEQANYPDIYINDNQRKELEDINMRNRDGPAKNTTTSSKDTTTTGQVA